MNLAESKNMLRSLAAEIIGRIPVERILDSRAAYLETLRARAAMARETMTISSLGFDPREVSAVEDIEFFAGRTARILGLAAQALRGAGIQITSYRADMRDVIDGAAESGNCNISAA